MSDDYAMIEDIIENKDRYIKMVNNTNVYKLRALAAERGIEMTIQEVRYYLNFILDLCEESE